MPIGQMSDITEERIGISEWGVGNSGDNGMVSKVRQKGYARMTSGRAIGYARAGPGMYPNVSRAGLEDPNVLKVVDFNVCIDSCDGVKAYKIASSSAIEIVGMDFKHSLGVIPSCM